LFVSAGDNSIYLNDYNAKNIWNNKNIDLVITYYGNNVNNFNKLLEVTKYVIWNIDIKHNNFFLFYRKYSSIIDTYKYVALFDDDIILSSDNIEFNNDYYNYNFNQNLNLLEKIFEKVNLLQPYLAQPACSTTVDKFHQISFWKTTHKKENKFFHYSPMIEINSIIFRIDCLKYIMDIYNDYFEKIGSYGFDIFCIKMLTPKKTEGKYLVMDEINYINPSIVAKKIKVREIDTNIHGKCERDRWIYFKKFHNI
jgi:hypothetical protein